MSAPAKLPHWRQYPTKASTSQPKSLERFLDEYYLGLLERAAKLDMLGVRVRAR